MRKVLAWLGAAALFMTMSHAEAANDVLKPYVVLILDTSGSMGAATGSGPTSCGKRDTRINHAVCAINSIVNSYGDMVFGLGRFRETTNGSGTNGSQTCDANGNQEGNQAGFPGTLPTPSGGDVCNTQGAICGDCDPSLGINRACTGNGSCLSNVCTGIAAETGNACLNNLDDDNDGRINDGCGTVGTTSEATLLNGCTDNIDTDGDGTINDGCTTATGQCTGVGGGADAFGCTAADREFEVLSPLVDGNNATAAKFTDGTCNACSMSDTSGTVNPEIWGISQNTFTPLAASLKGAQRYWEGNQATDGTTIWGSTLVSGANNLNNPGFDPINRDPSAAVFLAGNDQANCNANPNTCSQFVSEAVCVGGTNAGASCTRNADCTGGGTCGGPNCANTTDDDGDGRVNDGCPTVGGAAETSCAEVAGSAVDNDNDGFYNDGCQAWCNGTNCCCASQCRPYITILLTDGDETCTTFTNTIAAAQDLYNVTPHNDAVPMTSIQRTSQVTTITTAGQPALPHPFKVGDQIQVSGATGFNGVFFVASTPSATTLTYAQTGADLGPLNNTGTVRHTASLYQYTVQTKPIGFGLTAPDANIEAIAHAGGAPDVPNVNEGYYAADEADLELAISEILADSVRSELCNAKDDDCDVRIDEDFPNKGMTCSNGLLGICTATGTLICKPDGTGLQCNAPIIPAGNEGTTCNNLDDDCDGRIDEGLSCQSCVPTGEICDGADQDCDGVPDKTCRCSGGSNAGGVCDQVGSDCPGGTCNCTSLTRPCGVGTCAGIETCTAGAYTGCTAAQPTTETCDGVDNDCDGICDGFQLDCSEQVSACNPAVNNSCPATDSLGHPSKNPIPQNICRPGVRTCPLKGACTTGNSFGICSGEVKACGPDAPPGSGCDICNGLDDDCDNTVDEDFVGADCSTNCGIGTTVCQNGNIVCNSTAATGDATCDNKDDDCDGKFDEDWVCDDVAPADGQCDACGVGLVCAGMQKCVNGAEICDGVPVAVETCDCNDNNCNGTTDEEPENGAECDNAVDDNGDGIVNDGCPAVGAAETSGAQCTNAIDDDGDGKVNDGCPITVPALCPTGSNCVNCQCAFHCAASEFPCPLGKKCENTFCVNDPCFNVTCPAVNGNVQTCIPKPNFPNEPQCVDTCSLINDSDNTSPYTQCPPTQICVGSLGECRPNNCTTFPSMCTTGQSCINGTCVSNPCQGVTCDTDKYCLGGACISSCADVTCPSGQRCRQGACETDPCGHPCPFGYACNDSTGACIEDPCKFRNCGDGQWCNPNDGQCEDDPCVASGVTCPNAGEVCRGGTCIDPDTLAVDAAGESHVTVGGGGGCNTTGGSNGFLLAFALGLLLVRRRRSVGGAL